MLLLFFLLLRPYEVVLGLFLGLNLDLHYMVQVTQFRFSPPLNLAQAGSVTCAETKCMKWDIVRWHLCLLPMWK